MRGIDTRAIIGVSILGSLHGGPPKIKKIKQSREGHDHSTYSSRRYTQAMARVLTLELRRDIKPFIDADQHLTMLLLSSHTWSWTRV